MYRIFVFYLLTQQSDVTNVVLRMNVFLQILFLVSLAGHMLFCHTIVAKTIYCQYCNRYRDHEERVISSSVDIRYTTLILIIAFLDNTSVMCGVSGAIFSLAYFNYM